jgi:CBS domain-containing protein
MRLEHLMTRDLPSVSPGDGLRDAARLMVGAHVKALPVCDGDRLAGIITDWDIAAAFAGEDEPERLQVSDAMTEVVLAAPPDATLSEASELMGEHRLHHLCVSEEGRYLGMLHLDVEWAQLGGQDVQAPMATFMARV